MGYTHFWRRAKELEVEIFKAFAEDVNKLFEAAKTLGIALADGIGETEVPEASETRIWFNGSKKQPIGFWTTNESISIPWPSPQAGIIDTNPDPTASKVAGTWYGGHLLSQRCTPIVNGYGDGEYETFMIERVFEPQSWEMPDELGRWFAFCKTAYRPYDLIVTAVLVAFKHHFPEIRVSSDGKEKDWIDGKILCNNTLGYGLDFTVEK